MINYIQSTIYFFVIQKQFFTKYLLNPNTKYMKFALQNLNGVALLKWYSSYKNKQTLN